VRGRKQGGFLVTINLTNEAFNKARSDVREGAGRLTKDRDDIDRRVSGFLGDGWVGVAADSFIEAWDDWKVAATDVLDGLVAMGELLDATQKDFNAEDEESQRKLDAVSSRIIERLG
jgi:WXG100 family type VII secretion target